ncbi:MAG TPA: hypothetical protein VLI39_07715 [Sedimentisphaerales bacterium]|nr:hypothetical protein [Sedimentisphaerales bacterium]
MSRAPGQKKYTAVEAADYLGLEPEVVIARAKRILGKGNGRLLLTEDEIEQLCARAHGADASEDFLS